MANSKNLVFSSAGDRSNHREWISGGARDFELCLYYYGEDPSELYRHECDIYEKRKGTKSQNFCHFYNENRETFERFDNFFILDDDIEIDTPSINKLFEIFNEYQLLAAQPAYAPGSVNTWPVTRVQPEFLLRYTNFVEIGVLMIRREAVPKIIPPFSESLTTWGIDLLVSELLGDPEDKIAVIDAVTCIHPRRDGPSELDKILPRAQHKEEGKAMFRRFSRKEVFQMQEYSRIAKKSSN